MKKTILLSVGIMIYNVLSAQLTTPWNIYGSHIANPNTGNVGIKVNNPMYPFQIGDGGNDFSGIGFIPNNFTNQYAIIKSLKMGGYGLILRAENQNAGLGQAGVVIRASDGISIPSKVTLIGGQLDLRTNNDFNTHINDGTPGTSALFISNEQKVGMGISTPTQRLTVNGNLHIGDFTTGTENAGANAFIKINERFTLQSTVNPNNEWISGAIAQNFIWNNTTNKWDMPSNYSAFSAIRMESNGNLGFYSNTNTGAAYSLSETELQQYRRIWITGDGRVAIGNINPGSYKLAVDGNMIAKEIKVKVGPPFPDYVFDKDYNLMSLANLEAFIKKNNHLPNIPSAQEVKDNDGIELGAMNAKLLEKIEELTLYMIELKKENETTKEEVKKLSARLEARTRK